MNDSSQMMKITTDAVFPAKIQTNRFMSVNWRWPKLQQVYTLG